MCDLTSRTISSQAAITTIDSYDLLNTHYVLNTHHVPGIVLGVLHILFQSSLCFCDVCANIILILHRNKQAQPLSMVTWLVIVTLEFTPKGLAQLLCFQTSQERPKAAEYTPSLHPQTSTPKNAFSTQHP